MTLTAAVPLAVPSPSPWPAFAVASIATFVVTLDTTMLYAVFDVLRAGFPAATPADLSWVINAYTVIFAAVLIPAGGLADVHGRKRIFLLGVVVFTVASAACGLAPSVGWLIAARAAQAVGAALITPASLSIVLAAFPVERRAIAVASWGAVGAVAAAMGPSAGSLVADRAGWPWAFYINVPLGAYTLWRGARLLVEVRRPSEAASRRVDLVGMASLVVAVGALALAIVESGGETGSRWSRGAVLAVAATSALAGIAFVAWARARARAGHPALIDPALFRHRTVAFANVATLVYAIAFAMTFFGFFFYMRGIWHYSLPRAGLAIVPGPLLVAPVAIVAGRIAQKTGHRPILVAGASIYAASGAWLFTMPGLEPDYLHRWLPALLLSGIGVGLTLPSLAAAAVSRLPLAQYAVGSAVNQATRQVGSVLGVAITVVLLGHAPLVRGDFDVFYGTTIALSLATALLCLPIDTRPAPPR